MLNHFYLNKKALQSFFSDYHSQNLFRFNEVKIVKIITPRRIVFEYNVLLKLIK